MINLNAVSNRTEAEVGTMGESSTNTMKGAGGREGRDLTAAVFLMIVNGFSGGSLEAFQGPRPVPSNFRQIHPLGQVVRQTPLSECASCIFSFVCYPALVSFISQ